MIQQTEIKFVLHEGWGDFKVLWLMKYEIGKAFNGFLKDGNLEWKEVQEGSTTDGLIPFMKIPYRFPLQELINALSKQLPSTPTVETLSELKATKYHLEDLRKLLFTKNITVTNDKLFETKEEEVINDK